MAIFTSATSGSWTTTATWGTGGSYPGQNADGDEVRIGAHTVTYNVNNPGSYIGSINMTSSSGRLRWDPNSTTYLWLKRNAPAPYSITMPGNGAKIEIGSLNATIGSAYTATLRISLPNNSGSYLFSNDNNGIISIYGAEKSAMAIAATAFTANSTSSVTTTTIPSGWNIGDQLVVQATSTTIAENERISITTISGGSVFGFTGSGTSSTAQYSHLASALLLNMTRNVLLYCDSGSSCSGISGGNSTYFLNNARFYNFQNAINAGNQLNYGRFLYGSGLVFDTNTVVGMTIGNNDNSWILNNCIFAFNANGLDAQNQSGVATLKDCYFCQNTTDGITPSGRGGYQISDCYFWSHAGDGMDMDGFYVYATDCYFFNQTGYGARVLYCQGGEFFGCHFGESHAGTAANASGDFDIYRARIDCNDCTFKSTDTIDITQSYGDFFRSSNHNQGPGSLIIYNYSGSIQNFSGSYRTAADCIRITHGDTINGGNAAGMIPLMYTVPIKVTTGSYLTVTAYGKKQQTAGWLYDPVVRLIGCGIDVTGSYTVSDTNWNAVTLAGSTTRNGVVTLRFETSGSPTNMFYIDDISTTLA